MNVFACSSYGDPLKSLILAKGWSDIVSSRQLGEIIWQSTNVKQHAFDYLIPIPLHWSRFAKRGFNQAEEIATALARKSGKPVINLLRRIKRTSLQSGLTIEGRRSNICDAFEVNCSDSDVYKNKHLMLVDDLMTTGSTLRAAAQKLLRYKPASISAIVACRVV